MAVTYAAANRIRSTATPVREAKNVDVVLATIAVTPEASIRVIYKPADIEMARFMPARARDAWHVEIDGDEREDGALRFGHKRTAVANVTRAQVVANKWLAEARAAVAAAEAAETTRAFREP